MTMLTIELPDTLAQKAQQAGLLNSETLTEVFEAAIQYYAASRLDSILENAANNPEAAISMTELSTIRRSMYSKTKP